MSMTEKNILDTVLGLFGKDPVTGSFSDRCSGTVINHVETRSVCTILDDRLPNFSKRKSIDLVKLRPEHALKNLEMAVTGAMATCVGKKHVSQVAHFESKVCQPLSKDLGMRAYGLPQNMK